MPETTGNADALGRPATACYAAQGTVDELTLCKLLREIERNETNYAVRYGHVLNAVALAHILGYGAGFRIDPEEPEWPVAYIELPTGQVSWHIPQHPGEWDGHTTEEKYARCRDYDRNQRWIRAADEATLLARAEREKGRHAFSPEEVRIMAEPDGSGDA